MVELGLFDTLVPTASILTIFSLVSYILPKREVFGLYLLIWWAASVFLSLTNPFFEFEGQWGEKDGLGIGALVGFPAMNLLILLGWFRVDPSLRVFVFQKIKIWCLFAFNIYRLDGLSIVLPFWFGRVPAYLGIQMIVLDVVIGATAIGWTWITFFRGADALSDEWHRDVLWFWNSLGLYDLVSAYVALVMNYLGWGGPLVTQPAFSSVGFHPVPLIVLFQAPIAIAIHLLMLTSMDQIVQKQ
eukprot:CAMPEP_0176141080 /NCGR_PEP_ID=MMETSP0120_2-20121206/71732_1 /TAXON_ID=160619 /ORGANISM="Kryptoperidinium foliaceum, Strain CCMP 1326" /LENGTH=242 /DNA_ID=CAMNT_0017477197 /DNA_START=96 /DNA_END=821 /DNA_ORIENTATION=-